MKKTLLISMLTVLFIIPVSNAQINARLLRYPDVSGSQIVFTYAGDIWIVSKDGGIAQKLSSPDGEEVFARFSPDGKQIAFTGNYDGNSDVYTIPVTGGIPKRLTYHGGFDQLLDWHPDGEKVLFASSRESGRQRYTQFFMISKDGGMAEKMALPYGSLASFSPDGNKLAFNYLSRITRTWKRYRGGMAPDIWTYDLNTNKSVNVTNNDASDEFPMWIGDKIYYLSDQGPSQRYNLWVYDLGSQSNTQLTEFTDFDVHFPAAGPENIVFEAAGKLYLMDLDSDKYREVAIDVVTDQNSIAPRRIAAEKYLTWIELSPDGNRLIVEARGEVFSVPAKEGVTLNLTQSSGVADRFPTWSPDGKHIAYWSDASGEYQLTLFDIEKGSSREVTNYLSGYRYRLFWSPDSKKLAFVNQAMEINYFDLDKNQTFTIDKGLYMSHGPLMNFSFSWSPDSKWLTYANEPNDQMTSIFIYDTDAGIKHQVTSDYYGNTSPVFDPDGKYLYFLTNRNISPVYSDMDNTFIYPNSTQIAAVPLRNDVESPLKPKNDEVKAGTDGDDKTGEKETPATDKKKKTKDQPAVEEKEVKEVKIDLEGFERRIIILPVQAGNFAGLDAVAGKVIYHQSPNSGSSERQSPVKYYDLEKRKSETIIDDADGMDVSSDNKKIAVISNGKVAVVDIAAGQKMEKTAPLSDMVMIVDPRAEWKQIYNDAWRLQRDYFYDKNMHGLDWKAVGDQYRPLIDQCITRWDVNYVIGELIAELSSSHTYRSGGDVESATNLNVGYLGVDWELTNGAYRIKRIVRGADWDAEARSPLDLSGTDIKAGDYLLAVNGIPLDVKAEPFAAFQGLAGATVELTVNSSPTLPGARKVLVETLPGEDRLRHLEWIEGNRKIVDEASGGRIGYIYVRSTGIDGQNELVRQFVAQYYKDGLIIDERFNSGGQIPDRFIELLNRKPLAYWAVRDGKDTQFPPIANFGPKAMLINGWSGSGGDAFPDYFRKTELGPLIGTRTWGGLIGISGAPTLIDGGSVTVPTFRMYNPDGTWFKEGYGVDPDIEVKENPGELSTGVDAQLNRAIEYVNEQLKNYKGRPAHQGYEKR
ncbi:MAG: peptidase S41 [Bacteroidia bacterium]|nr:MAG: peptidase S41 [Bacteroidia bacterium]